MSEISERARKLVGALHEQAFDAGFFRNGFGHANSARWEITSYIASLEANVAIAIDLDSLPDGDVKASLYALIRSIHDLYSDTKRMDWMDSHDYVAVTRDQGNAVPWWVSPNRGCGEDGIGMTIRDAIDAAMHAEKGA